MNKDIHDKSWYIYIAECHDKRLYVGIALDVDKRIKEHNSGNGCRYTKFRKPLKLRYKESCGTYNIARKRELEVKRYSREKKLGLANKAEIFVK